ncbi:type II toxin-antitoxin system VapC family toxin [Nitrosococcus wardiae]|uniref:Ribonuclease VapC n=1 Tax=Nitrosococcus wardiae TaxID=1814290 RepID=A0A4V1AWH5_9GAMM|nr:type II toxin-antitoxin system VapC family toxin [Nitrosococcus wardiae]
MRYLLDTDICIYIINRQPAEVRDRFAHLAPGSVGISVVTYHELYFGALQSRHTEKNLQALQQLTQRVPALPWSTEAAIQTARLRLALKRRGQPIGSWDMQIAGHALALNLELVTNNIREFGRIEHLRVETWVKPNAKTS